MATVDIKLSGPQEWALDILDDCGWRDVTLVAPWGRGEGKSWFERFAMWLFIARYYGAVRGEALKPFRGSRVVGLCPTLKQFRDIHGALLDTENSGDWAQLGGKLNRSTLRIDFPDGSWFQPMPAQTATSKAARGQRCDMVLADECDDIPLDVFLSVIKPWLSEPWSHKVVVAGGTPRMGRNGLLYHLHKMGEQGGLERPYKRAS